MPQNINSVVLVGNLTRDPELRHTPSGTAVTHAPHRGERSRQASVRSGPTPRTTSTSPSGAARPRTARSISPRAARSASRGSSTWREWDAQDGSKRQSVEVVADNVQFLGSRGEDGGGRSQQFVPSGAAQASSDDFPAAAADDDIPF